MRIPLQWAGPFAAASLSAVLATAGAAETEAIKLTATVEYARTVSAVCTIMSPRDQASGLAYFLAAAGLDKAPTKDATEKFCGAFKDGLPLTTAQAKAVLTATAEAGGAPAPMKKDKDKDKPPPDGGGGGGGKGPGYFHLKIKILGQEFEIEVGRKTEPGSAQPADGGAGDDGGDTAGDRPDNSTPPYNPGPPPE